MNWIIILGIITSQSLNIDLSNNVLSFSGGIDGNVCVKKVSITQHNDVFVIKRLDSAGCKGRETYEINFQIPCYYYKVKVVYGDWDTIVHKPIKTSINAIIFDKKMNGKLYSMDGKFVEFYSDRLTVKGGIYFVIFDGCFLINKIYV
jgi:hypothetical protein